MRRTRTTLARVAGLPAVALLLALTGCRGERSDKPPRQFLPDMDDQPRWNPQTKSEFFADGRTMRQPVVGTVAFARRMITDESGDASWQTDYRQQRDDLLGLDSAVYHGVADGVDPAGAWQSQDAATFIDTIPIAIDMAAIERGRARFNIYCSVCHGYSGEGGGVLNNEPYGGMVGRRWTYAVPSFHDPKYSDPQQRTGRDGYLFYTARNGVEMGAKMPGYAHALSVRQAWEVVAYIRALQASRKGSLADVPQGEREVLERQRGGIAMGETP
ncbi:MAG: cytochrome c [Phycisphaeraceae bacterium]|nr:cytochrome c [Phycisphaeraceae bacterium]